MALLERESQLGSLLQYADEARHRTGRLVLISGEAGVGKTSLAEELQQGLPDATWAWGACDGLFTPRPLAPLHDIARELGGSLLEVVRGEASRDQIFDAVLHTASSTDGLTVLVVEDAQWADEATLDLLRFLARRIAKLPVLLLVTFRDDALTPSDPLRVALGELAGQRYTRRIDLPPLTAGGVRRLAEGSSYSPDELYELTGGNPFFVVEVLSDDGTEVPASARDAVLARAARLSEAARTTLDLASLDSWRVEPDLVARAGDLDPATFDELVAVGLLRAEGPTLRFRHELARRAIESEVPPHRRGAGHEALLQALVDVDCDDNARLAYHAEAAGEPDLVRRFAPVAARRAAELGAHREAVAQYERALRHPPLDERELAELFDGYAEALAIVDRWPAAAGARERAIVLWHRLGDVRREGYDHRKLATVYWRLCRGAESVQSQQRAITLLEPLGADPELARAYMAHAFDVWRDDPVGGPQMLQRASDIADELGDPSLRSDVLNNVSVGKFALRTEWSPTMDEALRLGLESDDENSIARAYANGYQYFCMQYRFAEGERYWREGVRFSDEHDITTYSSCLRGRRSLALLDLGRWDEAEDVAGRVLGMQASPVNRLTSLVSVGLIRARRGLDGLEALEEAVAAGDGVDEPEWIALARTARAEAHWIAGELDAARADLRVVRVRITPVEYVEDAKLSVWEERLLGGARPASPAPGPWATWLTGDFAATAVHWDRLSCPYDAAMALADSEDETPLRDAISRFEALGAGAVARRIRQRMKDLGHRAAPIGARASTREHPMGLTRREDEVLALVCEGLTNDEIAARLVVSTRTVDHHVSAVLAKLGVGSRGAAAVRARKLGLVPATT